MINIANFIFEKTGSQRDNVGIPSLCDRIVAEDDSVKYCPPARYSGPGQIPIYTKTDWDLDGSTFVHRHSTCMACGNCDCPGDTPAPANEGKVCPGQCCTDKFTGAPVLPGERRDKICVTTFPKAGTFMKVTIETG